MLDLEAAGGESVSIPGHRVVLVAGSKYFASLFSPMREQQQSGSDTRRVRVASEERLSHLQLFVAFLSVYGVEVELDLVQRKSHMHKSVCACACALHARCMRIASVRE